MPLLWFSVCFLVVVSAQEGVPKDCGDIHGDGVQEFRVQGQTYSAPCDQRVDTRGRWTVFQRRFNGSLSFNRTWDEYEHGFGDPSGEVWLGLKWIHLLTSTEEYSLRVDLQDYNGNVGYAVYDHFSVSGPDDNYTLTVSGYHGNIDSSACACGRGQYKSIAQPTTSRPTPEATVTNSTATISVTASASGSVSATQITDGDLSPNQVSLMFDDFQTLPELPKNPPNGPMFEGYSITGCTHFTASDAEIG